MMSLQSWWFPETDWDDYKNTRVTQVERCYAGWNKSWGGWYRAWNAASEPVRQRNRSVVFLKNFSEDDFVFRKGFVLGSEKKRKHGRG